MSYERIIRRALRTPWALTPDYLVIVQDVLVSRARGIRLSDEEIAARIEAQTGQKAAVRAEPRTDGVIAVIPVHGVIANRSFEASSGCTSAEFISRAARQLAEDASVKAILFDFATPGGTVEGVPEAAQLIRDIEKPTIAFVDAQAASAGYWLASQCDEIVMRASANCGSVGVYALTEDWSEWLAKEGIKINAISAGEYKLEGAPWEPLSDEARAYIQTRVDETYRDFLTAVAEGRGVSVADVKKKYGQGRCLPAKEAKAAGMVDRIGELDVAIGRANTLARQSGKRASATVAGRKSGQAQTAAATEDAEQPIPITIDDEGRATQATVVNAAALAADGQVGIEPRADGSCPDGYEQHEDGMCYRKPEDSDDEESAKAAAAAQQAQADRDLVEVARA